MVQQSSLTLAALALLLTSAEMINCTEVEVGTFKAADSVICRLARRSGGGSDADRVSQLDIEFRTSHASRTAALISLVNDNDERLTVVVANESELSLRLAWLPASNNSDDDDFYMYPDDVMKLATQILTLKAPGVGAGDWHRVSILLGSGGSVNLDGSSVGLLPDNFMARFVWNDTTQVSVGEFGYRGCIANASLDGVAKIPLHSESPLLNRTDFMVFNANASKLPGGGSGCRQEPCPCLPKGVCVYKQWNVLLECNCSRGYTGQRCESEWDTCQHLEPGRECLNGGECLNQPGLHSYKCRCTPAGQYVGSQCQSFNHCINPITCQNGATCSLSGDQETPSSLNYSCVCTAGFSGRNCTILATPPDPGVNTPLIVGVTVGVIAALLLLIAALVAVKVIRERRRDSGAYRPSQREESATRSSIYADQAMIGLNQVMRPPKEERVI